MAKRRNLKKEKALRNEAYARKFRKRNQRGRGGRRPFGAPPQSEQQASEPTGATDDV
jgi:hypothetical protein